MLVLAKKKSYSIQVWESIDLELYTARVKLVLHTAYRLRTLSDQSLHSMYSNLYARINNRRCDALSHVLNGITIAQIG